MRNTIFSLVIFALSSLPGCWAGTGDPASEKTRPEPESERDEAAEMSAGSSKNLNEGRYKLVTKNDWLLGGKYEPLCDEMLKNLNSFPDAPPMVCERKYNPELGFTTPDWEPVPKEEIDWEIMRQIYFSKNENRFSEEGLKKTWPKEKDRLQALAEEQTILWYAEFDIDNKEGREKVLMLRDADCSVDKYFGYNPPDPSLHVLDDSGGDISKGYDRLNSYSFDAFMYQGHTFLSAWKGLELKHSNAQLYVYTTFNPKGRFGFSSKYGCTFQYIQ